MTGVLLSYLLPEASIVLFDSNGGMDMAHVAARPNVRFRQLDVFAADALAIISEAAAGGSDAAAAAEAGGVPAAGGGEQPCAEPRAEEAKEERATRLAGDEFRYSSNPG